MFIDLLKAYPIRISLIIAVAVVVLGWYLYDLIRRRLESNSAVMTTTELKQLEKKQLLTPEEMKRVREAIAKQYIREQEERDRAEKASMQGMTGAELLALEAEKADELLAHKRPAPKPVSSGDGDKIPAKTKADVDPVVSQLPENLAFYAHAQLQELEDYRNAGFLSDEDFELILNARKSAS